MTDLLDDALDRLSGTGFEFGPGLSNHGPMAAEALVRLGAADAAPPWAGRYRSRLGPAPDPTDAVTASNWREALGDISRVADWTVWFRREMDERPWRQLMAHWVPRLVPGVMAAATHGVIRTAHAARALGEADTALRRDELAHGLAYWAARYLEMPGTPRLVGRATMREAVDRLPRATTQPTGLITQAVKILDVRPEFPVAVDELAAPASVDAALCELTEAFAGMYLTHADDAPIVFIHSVTGPAALRLLLPYVGPEVHATAFAYAWQTCAALAATYGYGPRETAGGEVSAGDLIDRAVANGDEHAIKMTEACLREHALNPKPVYLAAALDAVTRL